MHRSYEAIIVGGGLAGLCNAIHLAQGGINVLVIERQGYPHHKVCGEYISNEVIPYLRFLGIDTASLRPPRFTRFSFIHRTGKKLTCDLPLGGFGLSRFAFDHQLYLRASEAGATVLIDSVEHIETKNGQDFTVETKMNGRFNTKLVIAAHGKRSGIDGKLQRTFFTRKSPWLAVKYHARSCFDDDLVALYQFDGGYCGVSKIETGEINICYLADYESFRKHKNIRIYQENVLHKNEELGEILNNSLSTFEKPLAIGQIYFGKKTLVKNHILMSGDAGGSIHPLCGNGMAMAIESAAMLAPLVIKFLQKKDEGFRKKMEADYITCWNRRFSGRMAAGRIIQSLFKPGLLSAIALNGLKLFPRSLPFIIKQTHGSPFETAEIHDT